MFDFIEEKFELQGNKGNNGTFPIQFKHFLEELAFFHCEFVGTTSESREKGLLANAQSDGPRKQIGDELAHFFRGRSVKHLGCQN